MNAEMTTEGWRRLEEIFHAALPLSVGERAAYLARACAGDPALLAQVEALVAGHESGKAALNTSSIRDSIRQMAEADEQSLVGQDFGPYRVVREIGRGGMGRVYLAERVDSEFHKSVAIKLIKRGMDTDAVIRRFRSERDILASLDHPNIARLLDGGTTRDGLPYFVMEYIAGQPIDEFCVQRGYSIERRLELFRKVCDAVTYAHQHLVIHRDIKPSNILVTQAGDAKLLDFGLARLLRASAGTEATAMTGLPLMTPEYASPEQVLGHAANTLTDVYSLGVVLYKLLTGVTPFVVRGHSIAEMTELICRTEPRRPSVATAPHATGESGTRTNLADATAPLHAIEYQRQLRGDLDGIILMAMRKDPRRRYQSVERLSEDLRFYLSGMPVSAREDTFAYRTNKFVGRHRGAVAAGAVAALALMGGVVATSWQARRAQAQETIAKAQQAMAERRFNEVRRLAHTVLFDYHDAIKNLAGATSVRKRLVSDSLQYLDDLSHDAAGDVSLMQELASAYQRVSEVQGGTLGANLGDTAGAIESGKKALQMRTLLLAKEPGNNEMRRDLATSYLKVGELLWETGDMKGAADCFKQSINLREIVERSEPNWSEARAELSVAYDFLGMLLLDQGNAALALSYFRRSLALRTTAPAAEQASEKARRALSVAYEHIGTALQALGQLQTALDNNLKALEIRTALTKDYPTNVDHRRTLQVSYYNHGEIQGRMNRIQDALGSYRKDVEIGESLYREDPSNEQSRGDLAYGLLRVADMLVQLRRFDEALVDYRRSLDLRAVDVKTDPGNLWKRSSLIEAKAKICKALALDGKGTASRESCDGALQLMQATKLDPGNAAIRSFFADTYRDLARAEEALAGARTAGIAERQQRRRSALDLYRQSLQIWNDLSSRGILSPSDREKAAAVDLSIGQLAVALGNPPSA